MAAGESPGKMSGSRSSCVMICNRNLKYHSYFQRPDANKANFGKWCTYLSLDMLIPYPKGMAESKGPGVQLPLVPRETSWEVIDELLRPVKLDVSAEILSKYIKQEGPIKSILESYDIYIEGRLK